MTHREAEELVKAAADSQINDEETPAVTPSKSKKERKTPGRGRVAKDNNNISNSNSIKRDLSKKNYNNSIMNKILTQIQSRSFPVVISFALFNSRLGRLVKRVIEANSPRGENGKLRCVLCQVTMPSPQVAQTHFNGKKHQKKLAALKTAEPTQEEMLHESVCDLTSPGKPGLGR